MDHASFFSEATLIEIGVYMCDAHGCHVGVPSSPLGVDFFCHSEALFCGFNAGLVSDNALYTFSLRAGYAYYQQARAIQMTDVGIQ